LNWLDVGCGTGALTQTICQRGRPGSLFACDQSAEFVSFAQASVAGCPATFVVTSADNLPMQDGGFDIIVSGLVLNFLPQPLHTAQSMMERLRPGGTLAAYVWDYAEGMRFLRVFWDEAEVVDPSARELDEARRFPLCRPDRLADLWKRAGLTEVTTTSLQIDTLFSSFDDFWSPFLAGTGPAPSYVARLDAGSREQLALRLKQRLGSSADGSIPLKARAFGVRGVHTG
jgi:SAM-dependent methyltransferase